MRFNLKQIEAFVWVADLQSFRRAAERLNTTQPNISARISSLEEALGTALMTRDAGSVRLTGKGQTLPVSRSEEHTSELQSPDHLVCRLLLEKKKQKKKKQQTIQPSTISS